MKNVLIIGGAGFIGSNLIGKLIERDAILKELIDFSPRKIEFGVKEFYEEVKSRRSLKC